MSDGSYLTREELARRVDLLQQELKAEMARVQSLERNLDTLLRGNAQLESRLARTRAMLTVALGDAAVDVDAIKAELAGDRLGGAAAALSHALLTVLQDRPDQQPARA